MFVIDLQVILVQELRQRRQAAGLTQAEVAKRCGLTQPRIAGIESGGSSVTLDMLFQILHSIGLTPSELGALVARQD